MSLFGDMNATADTNLVWRALADPTRRAVLDLLSKRAHTTGEVVAAFPELSRTGVMKHMDVLVAAGLVVVRREGRVRWNHLNPVPIQRVQERWISEFAGLVASQMLAFKDRIESQEPANA